MSFFKGMLIFFISFHLNARVSNMWSTRDRFVAHGLLCSCCFPHSSSCYCHHGLCAPLPSSSFYFLTPPLKAGQDGSPGPGELLGSRAHSTIRSTYVARCGMVSCGVVWYGMELHGGAQLHQNRTWIRGP